MCWLLRKLIDLCHFLLGDNQLGWGEKFPCDHPTIQINAPSRCGVCGRLRDGSEDH